MESKSSETIEKDDDNIEVQVTCASTDTETSTDTFEEEITTVSRKSPSEPISTMCYSMKRQIISRAFYGWLAYCRHLKTIRNHLGGLTFTDEPAIPDDVSWHKGITSEFWNSIDW